MIYKFSRYFIPSFESNGLSVQEKMRKIDFQDGGPGGHLILPNGPILAVFDLQFFSIIPTQFRVNWPFNSVEEAQNIFSRWRPLRPSWILDRNDFSYFRSMLSQCSLPSVESIGFSV